MHPSTWWASDAKVRCSNSLGVGKRPRPEQRSNIVESNAGFSLVQVAPPHCHHKWSLISLLLAWEAPRVAPCHSTGNWKGRKVMVHRPIHLEHLFSSADLFKAAKGTKVKLYLQGSQKRSSSSPFRGSVSTPLWIRSKYLPDGVNTLASSWQWARQVQCILKIKIKWSSYIHQLEARKRNQWISNKKKVFRYTAIQYTNSIRDSVNRMALGKPSTS